MRAYLVFGSDDGVHFELLNTVEANGSEQALNKARDQGPFREYAATPERNWTAMTPKVVERAPVVKWTSVTPKQLTVDDVVEIAKEEEEVKKEEVAEEKAEAIKEAKAALGYEQEDQ